MDINKILKAKKNQLITPKHILDDCQKEEKSQITLHTGSNNFDEILGGGFHQGTNYLIFGANKTGKTQLSHQLSIQAYINFSDIFNTFRFKNIKYVYYFDTENTFRPERLKELADSFGLDHTKILESILVSKILSNSALLLSLNDVENFIKKSPVSVLIIDSINNHYNSDLADRSFSSKIAKERFLKILVKINMLTKKYNLITIALAQVSSNISDKAIIPVLPIGNHLLNHFFSEYIFLEFKNEIQRIIHLVNSLHLPEKKLPYKITSAGIQDY